MTKTDDRMLIRFREGSIDVPLRRLVYLESDLHKVYYFMLDSDGTMRTHYRYEKLDDAEQRLRDYGFYRIHQSFLVQGSFVKSVRRYKALLTNGEELNISKRYYKEAETRFGKQKL